MTFPQYIVELTLRDYPEALFCRRENGDYVIDYSKLPYWLQDFLYKVCSDKG